MRDPDRCGQCGDFIVTRRLCSDGIGRCVLCYAAWAEQRIVELETELALTEAALATAQAALAGWRPQGISTDSTEVEWPCATLSI